MLGIKLCLNITETRFKFTVTVAQRFFRVNIQPARQVDAAIHPLKTILGSAE